MLLPGYPLRFDLVSVFRPVLGDDALGLGDRLPRAIPLDAATAVLAKVLPDAWLTQAMAVLALVLAGTGAARLAAVPLPGRLVAVLAAQWNPFVLEQLAIGHVPHLLGYAASPWAGWAGWCLTTGVSPRRSWGVLVLAVALGSLTPGGGLLVALAALAGLLAGVLTRPPQADRRLRRLVAGLAPVIALQLPWLVAAAAHPGFSAGADQDAGLTAFALRAETGWGRLIDALGLAGMWNRTALPQSRTTILATASTVLVIGLALGGVPHLRRVLARRPGLRSAALLAALSCLLCYLVAVLPVLPGGERVLSALVSAVPGAGLLRDGHRWLALPAMGAAVLAAHAVTGMGGLLAGWLARRTGAEPGSPVAGGASWAVAVLTGLLLIASMPDLALGLGGRLRAWQYPPQWAQVRALLDAQPDTARVLVLPYQPFRIFQWSGPSAVLDPAPRLLPRQVIVSDALTVSGRTLPPEGPGARAIAAAIGAGEVTDAQLRAQSIGWVLVERGTAGRVPTLPAGWAAVAEGPELTLWRAPGDLPAAPLPARTRAVAVIGAHLLFALLVLIGAVVSAGSARRQRRVTNGGDAALAGAT
jgi:hypothetical protein